MDTIKAEIYDLIEGAIDAAVAAGGTHYTRSAKNTVLTNKDA